MMDDAAPDRVAHYVIGPAICEAADYAVVPELRPSVPGLPTPESP